jgi:hypothetical protein
MVACGNRFIVGHPGYGVCEKKLNQYYPIHVGWWGTFPISSLAFINNIVYS